MLEHQERELLDRIEKEGSGAWEAFLASFSDVIFRVVRLFADSYDDRMDLFLFACARLEEDGMRRVRSFRRRPEAPCRFSTWLAVVVKNVAVDYIRSRDGRFRPFRSVEAMEEADRLVFEYHVRDGRPLDEVRGLLAGRHGIRMTPSEVADRAARVEAALTPNQRWRLLARQGQARRPMSVDPVAEVAYEDELAVPLADARGGPEASLSAREADEAFERVMATLAPRKRLALALRYRDGLSGSDVAAFLGIGVGEADRLVREGIQEVRERLRRSGVGRPELEAAGMASLWRS
jgi:RNA polymerase sigma factor (sigma-70 family)